MMDFRYIFEDKVNKNNGKTHQMVVNKKGGSDGCVNFQDKDNMGLA